MNEFEKVLQLHKFVRIIDGDTFHYLDPEDRVVTFQSYDGVLLLKLSDPKYEVQLFNHSDKLNDYLNRLSIYEALNT